MAVLGALNILVRAPTAELFSDLGKVRSEFARTEAEMRSAEKARASAFGAGMRRRRSVEPFDLKLDDQSARFGKAYDLVGEKTGKVQRDYIERGVRQNMATWIRATRREAMMAKIGDEAERRLFGGPRTEAAAKQQGEAVGVSFMDSMEGKLGRGSTFGKTMKMLRGGGALLGLGYAANEFNELTKRFEDFALAEGPDQARLMAAEFLKSIPIVGQLGDGLAKVWGLLSGSTRETARMKEELRRTDLITESIQTRIRLTNEARKVAADFESEIGRRRMARQFEGQPFLQSAFGHAERWRGDIEGLEKQREQLLNGSAELKKYKDEVEESKKKAKDMLDTVVRMVQSDIGEDILKWMPNPEKAKLQDHIKTLGAQIVDTERNVLKALHQPRLTAWREFGEATAHEAEKSAGAAYQVYEKAIRKFGAAIGIGSDPLAARRRADMAMLDEYESKLDDWGDRIFEQTRTPFERMKNDLADLQYLLESNAIDEDTYGRAAKKATDLTGRGENRLFPAEPITTSRYLGTVRTLGGMERTGEDSLPAIARQQLDRTEKLLDEARRQTELLRTGQREAITTDPVNLAVWDIGPSK